MDMRLKNISADQFRNRVDDYLDEAEEIPVVISRHNRPSWVILEFKEYEQLKAYDTRVAFYTSELPEEDAAAFADGYKGRATPEYE